MATFLSRIVNDQRVRFLAVGATNTLVGYALFTLMTATIFAHIPFGYLISLVLSYAISIVLAFVLYRRFVFPVTGHLVRDFLRFVSVYLVAIGVNLVALPVLVEVGGLPPFVAQAIILVVTTLFSFFGHKLFSFRRPALPGGEDEPEVRD